MNSRDFLTPYFEMVVDIPSLDFRNNIGPFILTTKYLQKTAFEVQQNTNQLLAVLWANTTDQE